MPDNYAELVELARLCWRQAQLAQTSAAARELRKMAFEYEQRAVKLDRNALPVLAEPLGDKPRI